MKKKPKSKLSTDQSTHVLAFNSMLIAHELQNRQNNNNKRQRQKANEKQKLRTEPHSKK